MSENCQRLAGKMTPVLCDISRTISRAPHPIPTGIDRVERAYIKEFLNSDRPVWFLSRIAGGYALLDKPAMQQIFPMILGKQPWDSKDLIARIFGRKKPLQTQLAESTLRRLALGNVGNSGLAGLLKKLPEGFTYVNVGHSNRKKPLWEAVKLGGAGRMVAMIHDVIPLDFPEFSRPDTLQRFEQELRLTAQNCDTLIYNSSHTAERTQFWLDKWSLKTGAITALLGVDPLPDKISHDPDENPYFVVLGTIEPRKNHQLLLDIWGGMAKTKPAETLPHLHIVGRRGWLNDAIFDMLDNSPLMGKCIFEHNNLDDKDLSKLLIHSRALLFPSFAEGFGYPLAEALQKKIPVICSNLPCFQEISGDLPTYLSMTDKKGWENAIRKASTEIDEVCQTAFEAPNWTQHFHKIDTIL